MISGMVLYVASLEFSFVTSVTSSKISEQTAPLPYNGSMLISQAWLFEVDQLPVEEQAMDTFRQPDKTPMTTETKCGVRSIPLREILPTGDDETSIATKIKYPYLAFLIDYRKWIFDNWTGLKYNS